MFNKVILIGNLTRDIEMRYANNGSAIGNTGIAVNRRYNVNGEKREEVCFIDITFFGRTAEVANQYLRKGSQVLIEGRLQFDTWQDKNTGQNRNKHSVVVESMKMLGGGSQSSGNYSGGNQNYGNQNYFNQGGYGQGYNNYQNQNSQPKYNNYQNKQNQGGYQDDSYDDYSENIPDIDIDEDELPF